MFSNDHLPQMSKLKRRNSELNVSIVASIVSRTSGLSRPFSAGSSEEYDGGLLRGVVANWLLVRRLQQAQAGGSMMYARCDASGIEIVNQCYPFAPICTHQRFLGITTSGRFDFDRRLWRRNLFGFWFFVAEKYASSLLSNTTTAKWYRETNSSLSSFKFWNETILQHWWNRKNQCYR